MRTVRANGRTYDITTWYCKYDWQREGCGCCQPKGVIHPSSMTDPGIRPFVYPDERTKSRAYVFRGRSRSEGSSKSKYKR